MIEDIFVENLVDEPDDIERVIEDAEELRRDSDGGSGDDDKKKEKEEKEKPKIRKSMGPRPVLNAQRLKGPRGIASIEEFFSGVKLDGRRGKEEKDLDTVMKRLELWTHRLYPRGQFDDCLKKIEKLGTNKLVRNYITRIRLGMEDGSGESELIRDEPDSPPPITSGEVADPFDQLVASSSGPADTNGPNTEMTTVQKEIMLMNRLIAEERRAARIKRAKELQAKFRAQLAAKAQSANGEGSSSEVQSSTQEARPQSVTGVLQMEVDNHIPSVSVNQRESEDGGDQESKIIEIQPQDMENINSEPSSPLGNEMLKDLDSRSAEEPSAQDERMLVDDIDPGPSNCQDKCGDKIKENISQNNGVKVGEVKEMGHGASLSRRLSTENQMTSEVIKSNDKDITVGFQGELKGNERNLKEQLKNDDHAPCFGKENENPNFH